MISNHYYNYGSNIKHSVTLNVYVFCMFECFVKSGADKVGASQCYIGLHMYSEIYSLPQRGIIWPKNNRQLLYPPYGIGIGYYAILYNNFGFFSVSTHPMGTVNSSDSSYKLQIAVVLSGSFMHIK